MSLKILTEEFYFFFLIAAAHPHAGMSMLTETDDVLGLLLTNGSIFSLRVVKGLPGKACGCLGQTRWLKISYSATYPPLLLVYLANRNIKQYGLE